MGSQTSARIREPAVAGAFYPRDPLTLARTVEQYLSAEPPRTYLPETLRILLTPHAGYLYSGGVAGAGFAQVKQFTKVILLGVSHQARFDYMAVSGVRGWQTPLGQVTLDRDAITRLRCASGVFRLDDAIHEDEHGLEVQLPFLQTALSAFQIIPLLLGGANPTTLDAAAETLADSLDGHTLLVISSDLSHYPCQTDARRVDRQTLDAILALDAGRFQTVITSQLRGGIPGLLTCACGAAAIVVALQIAKRLSLRRVRLLRYCNSGDVSGDSQRVVGYASVGFYSATDPRSTPGSSRRNPAVGHNP
jgi:hypothetical protein